MALNSPIEWTDATWNPLLGCSKVSAGCTHCYAERFLARWRDVRKEGHRFSSHPDAKMGPPIINARGEWTGHVRVVEKAMDLPLRWRTPRRVFVNSESDLFHENVSEATIARIFAVMAQAKQHTFQVLTKRPQRMAAWMGEAATWMPERGAAWPLPNVWLGTSVEDQAAAEERVPHLLRTPAAVRFLSCEPLLGPLDLEEWLMDSAPTGGGDYDVFPRTEEPRLHWVIVGGESGPGARPFDLAWARSLVEQCRSAGVAVFVKQLGSKPTTDHRTRPEGEPAYWTAALKDRKGGDPSEWSPDLRVREFPNAR